MINQFVFLVYKMSEKAEKSFHDVQADVIKWFLLSDQHFKTKHIQVNITQD